ncbi:MAG TPA: hypothetical protein VFA84_04205 [Acidimicrobiales bacterium]|nr:hypothetical protein [Acidimicrobiales bacterium]
MRFVAPTVSRTAVTGCTVAPGGGGTVTYAVSFTGGSAWAPSANYRNGAYTVNVVGGTGPHSGLTAIIAGAPIEDTADRVASYVAFPAQLVLTARC